MATRVDENILTGGLPESRAQTYQYFVHGSSSAMRALERTIADISSTDIPVLLVGESGTGKEVAALEIHRLSRRRNEPFVKCGCSGLTGDSLSARLQRVKNISDADQEGNGSLFLDGINHLDAVAQGHLLNLLPDGSGTPPQGCHSMRVISSTTRSLEEEMKSGRFREELYYRVNGVHLRLPPLRERMEDIPALLEFFFKKYTSLFERPEPNISESTMNLLLRHSWPGNIRELENVAQKIVALGDETLATHDLLIENGAKATEPIPGAAKISHSNYSHAPARSLKEAARAASRVAEREMILQQLERTHWNRKRAARELQISYKALLYKLKQLGLDGSGRPDEQ
ncbi:MAG TPA: sigma 54-interacting transcriptional regulator [Candidatus Acidoferrales bacterium]